MNTNYCVYATCANLACGARAPENQPGWWRVDLDLALRRYTTGQPRLHAAQLVAAPFCSPACVQAWLQSQLAGPLTPAAVAR